MDVGVSRKPGHARLDGDELASELHGIRHPVTHEEVGVRDGGVAPPDDGALGAHPLGVVIAKRGELREVGDEHATIGHDHERKARQIACGAGQEAVLVGATHGVGHAADLPLIVTGGAAQAVDGIATVGHGDATELLVAGLEGLIPGDALPLVLATLASALHGVQDAVGMELDLLECQAARAQGAAVVRIVRVALALDEATGLRIGVHEHAATLVTAGSRPYRGTRDEHAVFHVLPFAGMLPVLHLGTLASTEVELVLLLGGADVVAILLEDYFLFAIHCIGIILAAEVPFRILVLGSLFAVHLEFFHSSSSPSLASRPRAMPIPSGRRWVPRGVSVHPGIGVSSSAMPTSLMVLEP